MTEAERLSKTKRSLPPIACRKVVWRCTLLDRRQRLNLSLRDIEGATGITSASLSTVERGSDLTLTTARKIADFFGASVEELWPSRLEAGETL